jgi:hypothetical protein
LFLNQNIPKVSSLLTFYFIIIEYSLGKIIDKMHEEFKGIDELNSNLITDKS